MTEIDEDVARGVATANVNETETANATVRESGMDTASVLVRGNDPAATNAITVRCGHNLALIFKYRSHRL